MKVCVVGLGYVGLPLAVALDAAGVEVVGLDVSADRMAELTGGRSGIEDISDEQVSASGITFTTEPPADCTAYVVCVPTPLEDGLPDLTAVTAATRSVASVLKPGDLFVLESTTYPGTTEEVVAPLLRSGAGHDDFLLAYSPERIDPGNPTYSIANTPKVVGGTTPEATAAAAELYGRVVEQVVLTKGTREAEMAKLLENTFRHVNIALV
ncbi:MAG: nucleotide sugar dehydrogenase, partial [Frankiales bacterium]|nr:nucleotide sugar dehydrogenase [Frankiales bacterium]